VTFRINGEEKRYVRCGNSSSTPVTAGESSSINKLVKVTGKQVHNYDLRKTHSDGEQKKIKREGKLGGPGDP